MTSRNLGASLMLLILAQLMVYCLLHLLSSYMCATNHLNRCRVYIFSLLSCSFARRSHLRWRDQMLTRPTLTFSALSLSISSLDLCLICPSWWLLLLPRLGDGRLRGWMVCRTTGRVRNCCTISRVGYPYSVNAHSISGTWSLFMISIAQHRGTLIHELDRRMIRRLEESWDLRSCQRTVWTPLLFMAYVFSGSNLSELWQSTFGCYGYTRLQHFETWVNHVGVVTKLGHQHMSIGGDRQPVNLIRDYWWLEVSREVITDLITPS